MGDAYFIVLCIKTMGYMQYIMGTPYSICASVVRVHVVVTCSGTLK